MSTRQLTPYEKTHLSRFGQSKVDIAAYGEMPVEYITGRVEFGGQVFVINQHTLIPRLETEELVNLAVAEIRRLFELRSPTTSIAPIKIAEIGTGCGAIAISLQLALQKLHIPVEIVAGEISEPALAVARQNVTALLGKDSQVSLVQSDLLANFPAGRFDLIIANLPYIPSQRIEFLDASVKHYEPHLALDGGIDGLRHIKQLLRQTPPRLTSTGTVILEVDYTHTADFLIRELPLKNNSLQIIEDQFSRTRFAVIRPKSATIK